MFTEAKREMPVYFHYDHQDIDQVTITYPASMQVESTPQLENVKFEQLAYLSEGSVQQGNSITLNRNFAIGSVIFTVEEYDKLRDFYAKVNHKDQEQAVLKVASNASGN